jgi:hypothetical protein
MIMIVYMVVGFTTSFAISSNPTHGEMYSIQHCVIKFVSGLRQVCGFLWNGPLYLNTNTITYIFIQICTTKLWICIACNWQRKKSLLIYTCYINILCFTHLMQNYNFKKDTSISLVKILHNNFYIINHVFSIITCTNIYVC